MRYCSTESAHGSESSHGFANDSIVRVFVSKSARDAYVARSCNISCTPIKTRQATREAANWSLTSNRFLRPASFSGEHWGIVAGDDTIDGCLGTIEVCRPGDNHPRFYQ